MKTIGWFKVSAPIGIEANNNKIFNSGSNLKPNIGTIIFFTFKAKITFIKLRQIFIKALIFLYFKLKYWIGIKIDISNYIIKRVFGHLTLYNLD